MEKNGMKYYEEYIPKNLSVYEYLVEECRQYDNLDALGFYGKTFSYNQMFEEINKIAAALKANGIKKDDVIAASLPGCPEGIFLIYAINKIGAIYCAFDCRSKKAEIEETLNTFKPKLCFVPSFQIKEFQEVYEYPIVCINITHSLNNFVNYAFCLADFIKGRTLMRAKHKNIITYDDFIKKAHSETVPIEKSSGNIFGYFYTSGTTYGRKSIILTNENINAATYQQRIGNPRIKKGDVTLNIMPLFTCYSVVLAVNVPLVSGVQVEIVPLLNPKKLKKVIIRKKPNFLVTVPAHWEHFVTENFEGCDLSFVKAVAIGGDVMNIRTKTRLNEIFKACGNSNTLVIGYGLSETTSTATTGMNNAPENSVGYPFINTLIKIFDPDTQEQLEPYKAGEICICGPTVCVGYYNDAETTKRLLKKHDDGKVWLHSGDRGYMDGDGAIYFCERFKRMYVRFDGTKVSPYAIEQTIYRCPEVEGCIIVCIDDPKHLHGKCGKALIVLKKSSNQKRAKNMVKKFINSELDEHLVPEEIVFVNSLPYTKNGKIDFFGV